MSCTRRYAAMQFFGAAVMLIAAVFFGEAAFYVFLPLNALLLALLTADLLLSPNGLAVDVERASEVKLYYKTENEITIDVTNYHIKPLKIAVKDEIPGRHFKVTKKSLEFTVNPDETKTFSYTVIPSKRGSFVSKRVYVKFVGDMGLCVKYFKEEIPTDYKVYPNLKDLSKYRLIIQKDRLLNYAGRTVKLSGAGTEFESLREYVPGDDIRKINWNATARERKLIVKNYEPERNQPVTIMVDSGRAMSYSVKGYKKLDYAINAALVLSDIVNQKGDLSGLILYNAKVTASIKAGKGAAHRNLLMETLYHAEDSLDTPDYEAAFAEVNRLQPARSIVFIFTDFETFEEADDLRRSIVLISKKHIPIVILVKNESAETLLELDAENTKNIFVKASAYNFFSQRKKIIKELNLKGVKCIETDAENFAMAAVNRYLMLKSKM